MRSKIYIILLVMLACISCTTTKQIEKVDILHDTVYHNSVRRDSIYMRDSVYTIIKGDTVIIKEYHNKILDRSHTDTVYISKEANKNEKQVVVKEKSFWEKMKDYLDITVVILFIVIVATIVWKIIKK